MAQDSAAMSKLLNLSRQRNQTLIFVSQESRQIDRNIASSASVVVFKELGMLQQEFERTEIRKLAIEADIAFAGMGKGKCAWEEALAHFEKGLAGKSVSLDSARQTRDEELATLLFGIGRAQLATLPKYRLSDAVANLI